MKTEFVQVSALKVGDAIISNYDLKYTVVSITTRGNKLAFMLKGKLPWHVTVSSDSKMNKVIA